MDEATTESAMQLANQLAGTQTETVSTDENLKETQMADTTTRNIFNATPGGYSGDGFLGGSGMGGGGISGFLLGALLSGRNGLFGGNGVDASGNGVNAITQQMLSQDLGDIKAGVATSALETQKAVAASNMDVNATLFNQSAAIQGQINNNAMNTATGFANTKDAVTQGVITSLQSDSNILNAITNTSSAIERAAAGVGLAVERTGAAGVAATITAANASALQNAALQALVDRNAYLTSNKISDDGEKTRDLITRQYEDTLNRQLSTAQAEIIELRNDRRITERTRDVEVNVNQNMNNAISQAQAQTQLQSIAGTVAALANEVQRNSQSIVNLGTMSSGAGQQTAANTRVL